ncbi:MAG: bifunctional DNA-formamidopyrimidine glycosylase/DNA-(apurinic or apyrimidinic site) lyase [Bacillota bacterium]
MPELPEVETIVRSLQPLVGQKIKELEIVNPVVLKQQEFPPPKLRGKTIAKIMRRGKFLIVQTKSGTSLVVHLGMSGRFYLDNPAHPRPKHTHAYILLENGKELRYCDPRRFGGVWLTREPFKVMGHLGVEPLGPDLTREYLAGILRRRQVAIKNLLLNQQVIAGIGNIYADEILHRARISPMRLANSLTDDETARLHQAIIDTLEEGIANRGTTFRDYRDGFNLPGSFQEHLCVYGREGQPCPQCGRPITRVIIGGRSSHFCEHCQE